MRNYFKKGMVMKAIVISPESLSDLQFIRKLLKKLSIPAKVLSTEEVEDLGMSISMNDADRTKKVSRDSFMKKLRNKES